MNWEPDRLNREMVDSTKMATAMDTHLDAGKSSPTSRLPSARVPVGDRYIDHGTTCDAGDNAAASCLLEPEQRRRLVESYQHRVGDAHTNYVAALVEMRVDELLKHDDNDIGWIAGLLISLVTGYIGYLAGAAIKMMANLNTEARAKELAAIGPTRPIATAFTSEKQIDGLMSSASGTARAYIIPSAGAELVAPAAAEHQRVVGFVDQLKDAAGFLYQDMAERPPGTADDEQMIALWLAMHARNHDIHTYKDKIANKIAAFKKSRASWIGTRRSGFDQETGDACSPAECSNDAQQTMVSGGLEPTMNAVTTCVVWRTLLGRQQNAPQLYYYDDHADAHEETETADGHVHDDNLAVREHDFGLVAPVESDLVQVAIDRHTSAFGEAPRAMIIDARDPNPQMWRRVVDPFSGGKIPTLQLGGSK